MRSRDSPALPTPRVMALLFYLVIAVLVIAAIVIAVLLRSGLLYSPILRVSHPASLPSRAAFILKSGPYKNAGKEFSRLKNLAGDSAVLFGVYYDDPNKVRAGNT